MTPKELAPHPIDIEVGQRLRAFRLAKGVSQTSLAARGGITFQQVQKYERGLNRISASKLCILAEVLEIDPAELLPESRGSQPLQNLPETASAKTILTLVNQMSEDRRSMVLKLVRALGEG